MPYDAAAAAAKVRAAGLSATLGYTDFAARAMMRSQRMMPLSSSSIIDGFLRLVDILYRGGWSVF